MNLFRMHPLGTMDKEHQAVSDLAEALSPKPIEDYSKVPHSLYMDWRLVLKMNADILSPRYRMLSEEAENRIKKHIREYENSNKLWRDLKIELPDKKPTQNN